MKTGAWFLFWWVGSGFAAILLGVLMQRLKNPGVNMKVVWVNISRFIPQIFVVGPLLLIIGLFRFIADRTMYQSKNEHVLRKFEL